MNEWIVIVDMEQPDIRRPVSLTDMEDDFSCAAFESVQHIERLKRGHPLGVFVWWAFNYVTGEAEEL